MILKFEGGLIALLLALITTDSHAETLTASLFETGQTLASFNVDNGDQWCILWRHSVKGFEVSDCYQNREGQMVLVRSHLPDFAAGLDHIPGRGTQISDGHGGYWIEDIDEAVLGNAYVLRPGAGFVDHRIRIGEIEFSLSEVAEHERVLIALLGE